MPLTKKGRSILRSMEEEYGRKKGKSVFYASRNAGKISGVDMARTLSAADAVAMIARPRIASRATRDRAAMLAAVRDAAAAGVPPRDALAECAEDRTIGDIPLSRRGVGRDEVRHGEDGKFTSGGGSSGGKTASRRSEQPDYAVSRTLPAPDKSSAHQVKLHKEAKDLRRNKLDRATKIAFHANFHMKDLPGDHPDHAYARKMIEHTFEPGVARDYFLKHMKGPSTAAGDRAVRTGDEHEGFEKLDRSLAHRKGVHNAAALAAFIGRKKMGKAAFQRKAAAGR